MKWMALPLAAFLMLSGCTDEALEPVLDEPVETPDVAAPVNETVPELLFTVSVVNGTAPLLVNFSASLDMPLNGTWSLDFGDDNQTEGALVNGSMSANHTYGPGAHQSVLNVTANGTSFLRQALINVTAGGPAPGSLIQAASFEESGTLLVGFTVECGVQSGVDANSHEWDLSAVVPDAYQVANIVMDMSLDNPTNIDTDVDLIGPDGSNLGASHDFNALSGSTEHIESAGPHAPGIYTFEVIACTGAQMEYTITAVADIIAA